MKQRAALSLRVGAIPLGWRATLFLPVALSAISCERLPTGADKVAPSRPSFAVVPGGGSWTTKAPMPTARAAAAAGVINGVVYVVGGSDNAGSAASKTANEAYDPATDTWVAKAPDPIQNGAGVGVAFAGAGVIAGKLYVVGGCVFSDCIPGNTNILEIYDPVANAWTTGAPMPTARNQMAVGVINGKLYVVGGEGQCGPCIPTSALEVYDPSTNSWTTKAPMPTARSLLTAGVVNGILYAIGGTTKAPASADLGTVEAYDPSTDTWTTKAPLPTPRAGSAAGVVNGIIYVAGGGGVTAFSNIVVNTVEAYDPVANAWTEQAPMPTARTLLVSGVVSDVFYAIGGVNASNVIVATNEAFTPLQPPATLTLTPLTAVNPVGTQHCVTATVEDASSNPVPGVTVRFSVGPSVPTTFPTPSHGSGTTDANGQATFCYTASLPGSDLIHAFADVNGDGTEETGEPSGDAAKTWTPPASTHLCQVTITDGGWIIANNTDRANFGGNAKVLDDGTPQGQENYQDQGPFQAMKVHSTEITATTCTQDRTTASIFGKATIDGAGPHVFRIDVTDAGAGGSNDTYGIMLETGYTSGQHQLGGGNVTIH